jgi:TRAP-type C4-dicarboxylate transport system permease small subunit
MKLLGKLFDKLLTATLYMASVFTLLLVLSISYDVVMRYFFVRPTGWANDLSGYLVYAITFLGAACVQRERSHISIDILIGRFDVKTRMIVNCVTSILSAIFCGIYAWKGFEATWVSYTHRYPLVGGIKIPEFTILWLLPVGMFLLFIELIRLSRKNVVDLRMIMAKRG